LQAQVQRTQQVGERDGQRFGKFQGSVRSGQHPALLVLPDGLWADGVIDGGRQLAQGQAGRSPGQTQTLAESRFRFQLYKNLFVVDKSKHSFPLTICC
jgi:hypothetical protein